MGFLINGQPLQVGRPFTDALGTQYPANWLKLASEEEREAIGITWEADPAPVDTRFYWSEGEPRELDPLKIEWVGIQKQTAASLLASTDWYVTRKAETDVAIPADVLTYRTAIRTCSGTREGEINACATTEELVALLTNPTQVMNDAGEMVANTEPFITPWPEQE